MLLLTQMLHISKYCASLVTAGTRYQRYNRMYLFCQIRYQTAIMKEIQHPETTAYPVFPVLQIQAFLQY